MGRRDDEVKEAIELLECYEESPVSSFAELVAKMQDEVMRSMSKQIAHTLYMSPQAYDQMAKELDSREFKGLLPIVKDPACPPGKAFILKEKKKK